MVDVGVIGLPNSGKSTLLSKISNLEPKIAPYPFTTTSPLLGVARTDDEKRLTLVEVPAIVEGSHRGKGLGLRFLKHIERAKVLLFLLDASQGDPGSQYESLKREIALYNPMLLDKPRVVALNKTDLTEGQKVTIVAERETPVCPISALRQEGLHRLFGEIREKVQWEEQGEDRLRPETG